MNNDQLEACLKNLKSSSCEPDKIDGRLEERMMELSSKLRKKRRKTKHLAVVTVLLLVSATGFVALGGDSVVMNYIAPSTERDANGNPVPYDFDWGKWLHSVHDHLWEHFHGHHGGKGGT
jgi:hypothetical protein